jgi:plastocyanin
MKSTLLTVTLLVYAAYCSATIFTVTNSGNTFTPNLITINDDDTVRFLLGSSHDAREVSMTTWNSNGNTPLSGGFQTPFSGGFVLSPQLTPGTHYYVCTPHAQFGMKGRIIVNSTSGIPANASAANAIRIFPNPFSSKVAIEAPGIDIMAVYNILGMQVRNIEVKSGVSSFELYTTGLDNGIYFFKFFKDGKVQAIRKVVKVK